MEFYIKASESVKDELYLLAEKNSRDGVLSLSDMHKQNRLTELDKKYEKIIEGLGHDTEDFAKKNMQQGKTVTEIAVMLHNRMGQGFNDCHRLVRTETMHYLNDATLHRYKDAGVQYFRLWMRS